MKLVHLSDLHLGFRQYHRLTERGLNQREADVAKAFQRAIDKVIEIRPDLILIGGDVFHSVRPTNPALLHSFQQFARLTEELPDAKVVMVAGNHDAPRTTETGWILRLFSRLGIDVAEDEPRRISFRDAIITAVPAYTWIPPRGDESAKYNVLLLHNLLEEVAARIGPHAHAPSNLRLPAIEPQRWSYVGLGHYHVFTELASNTFYSGALEYTSSNIWGEIDEERRRRVPGKGFIEYDLETGAHRFHHVPSARRILDLRQIEAKGMTAAEISDAIAETVEKVDGGIDDRIVRLIVRDVERHMLRELDHRRIREYKRRALNFHLDARRPEPMRVLSAGGASGKRVSLADAVRTMLETRETTPGIDREALVKLGLHYLAEADRMAPAAVGDDG